MIRAITVLLMALALPAFADELETLRADDKLRLSAWITPDRDIVVGQEVRLIIEVSTPRWFAGGTRVLLPEVDNVVVLRRNEFANNFSRREAADTWVVQQWQLEFYPQIPGSFRVPPITLLLSVNDARAGIVKGRLETPALTFTAGIPPALVDVGPWLATPNFQVSQRFDRALDGLRPGDAFTRHIEFQATELTAMMLPEPTLVRQQGLALYPDPPELVDRSNRGDAIAIRRQAITYLVERQGQYRLPEQTWHWWNTREQRLEIAAVSAVDIDAGLSAPAPDSRQAVSMNTVALAAALSLLVLAIASLVYARRGGAQAQQRRLLRRAARALQRGSRREAASLLYTWLNTQPQGADWLSLRNTAARHADRHLTETIEALLCAAYAGRHVDAIPDASALRSLKRAAANRPARRDSGVLRINPTYPRK